MASIDNNNAYIPSVRFTDLTDDPDAPSTGGVRLYVKNGALYFINSLGTVSLASGAGTSAYPALSGLATGAVLRATSATTAAFGQLNLADTDAMTGVLPAVNGGTGVSNGSRTLTINTNAGALTFGSSGLTLTIGASVTVTGATGKIATFTGNLTVGADTTLSGGGTISLGGFTLTVPATGTAALLATANVFTAAQGVTLTGAGTNDVADLLTLRRETSDGGGASGGFGARLLFRLESTVDSIVDAGAIEAVWPTVVGQSAVSLRARDSSGLRTGVTVGANGSAPTLSFYGGTPVAQAAAPTTADASTVDATYGTEEADVINNLRTRLGEVITALKNVGIMAP